MHCSTYTINILQVYIYLQHTKGFSSVVFPTLSSTPTSTPPTSKTWIMLYLNLVCIL